MMGFGVGHSRVGVQCLVPSAGGDGFLDDAPPGGLTPDPWEQPVGRISWPLLGSCSCRQSAPSPGGTCSHVTGGWGRLGLPFQGVSDTDTGICSPGNALGRLLPRPHPSPHRRSQETGRIGPAMPALCSGQWAAWAEIKVARASLCAVWVEEILAFLITDRALGRPGLEGLSPRAWEP